MKFIREYAIIIVIIALAFWVGRMLAPKPDPEVENKFIQERIILQQQIDLRNAEISKLEQAGQAIKEKMIQDSLRFSGLLKAKETRITDLKRKINEGSLKNASTLQLDSVARVLYGTAALHRPRN